MRDPSPPTRGLRGSMVAAVATCPLLLCLVACGSPDNTGAASAPRSTAPSAPSGSPTVKAPHYRTVTVNTHTKHASRATAHSYVAGTVRLLASPSATLGRHPAISGAALQNLVTMRKEYASKHFHVVGRPTIVSQQVIKHQRNPPRLVVAACLDNSAVKVLDKNGGPVGSSQGPQRVMNLLTLALRHGRWTVTRSTLPSNPTC